MTVFGRVRLDGDRGAERKEGSNSRPLWRIGGCKREVDASWRLRLLSEPAESRQCRPARNGLDFVKCLHTKRATVNSNIRTAEGFGRV
jgi:hypothetical protein